MILKQVVRFQRSTTVKMIYAADESFNPILEENYCNNCRGHIITDKFLNKIPERSDVRYQRIPMGTYPYVIIIDTAFCNLRCRPCYS